MISGLSVPTKNLKFSLPICLFSVNIVVHRIDIEVVADVLGILTRQKTWT